MISATQYQNAVSILTNSSNFDPLFAALLSVPIRSTPGITTGTSSLSSLIKEVDSLLSQQGYDKNTQNAFNSYISAAAKALNAGSNINIVV